MASSLTAREAVLFLRVLRFQVAEQLGEARLEGVMVLPIREVRDEVLADLDAEILAAVRVKALPIPDRLEVHQADREQLPLALLDLDLPGLADLGLDPLAVHAVRGEDQE